MSHLTPFAPLATLTGLTPLNTFYPAPPVMPQFNNPNHQSNDHDEPFRIILRRPRRPRTRTARAGRTSISRLSLECQASLGEQLHTGNWVNQGEAKQLNQINSSLFHLSRDRSSLPAAVLQHQQMVEDLANASRDPFLNPRKSLPRLTQEQIRQLLDFVKSSPHARRMPLKEIPAALGLQCPERTITLALRRNGFKSYPAIVRPRINETTRQARLHFATTHVQWTVEQWKNVLFTGDMRLYLDQPDEALITREADEGLHPDCINHVPHSPTNSQTNILYIAHFSGATGKGPFIQWNPFMDYMHGNLTQENYYRVCYPSFESWLDEHNPTALFAQQPNSEMAFYSGVAYRDGVRDRHMPVLSLPPASPDLNPLTEIFNNIKAAVHADRSNPREYFECDESRVATVAQQTWKSISDDYIRELMESMAERCQAVIDADGLYTRF